MVRKIVLLFPFAALVAVVAACGGSATVGGDDPSRITDGTPRSDVMVELTEYRVTVDRPSVEAGIIRFTARNMSESQIHELAVLRVKADGSYENAGEVEDLDPGAEGSIALELAPGRYVLACLIVPGEAGSATDHFQQGMRSDFTVTGSAG